MRLLTDDETFAVFGGADSGDDSGDDSGRPSDDCDDVEKRKRRDDCRAAVAMCGSRGVKEYERTGGWGFGRGGLSASSTVTVVCQDSGGSDD